MGERRSEGDRPVPGLQRSSEEGRYKGRPRPAVYVYRSDASSLRLPSPLWLMVLKGSEPEPTNPDRRLIGRISEAVSFNTEELITSATEGIADKAREEFKPILEQLNSGAATIAQGELTVADIEEIIADIADTSVLALFDALADGLTTRLLTPKAWAEDCVDGLDPEVFGGPSISALDKKETFELRASAIVAHFATPEHKPQPDDVFRYRDRWFSLPEVTEAGIRVQPLTPLIALGQDDETKYQLIVPVKESEIYDEEDGSLRVRTDPHGKSTDIHLRGEEPFPPDRVQVVKGAIMVDVPSLIVDGHSLRVAKYGNDRLVLMEDN